MIPSSRTPQSTMKPQYQVIPWIPLNIKTHWACILSCTAIVTFGCDHPPTCTLPAPSLLGGPPRMTRSNSIPTQDTSAELYGASPLGSTLSLAERPRSLGMVHSGSFRDKELNDESKSTEWWLCVQHLPKKLGKFRFFWGGGGSAQTENML